ncbi:MAG TPA: hypothetical protein VGB35_09795 [Gammaproteobacteria bacterium]
MKDDLNKAEREWAQRRLFTPKPRRLGRWLWLLLLPLLVVLLYWLADGASVNGIGLPPI